MAEHDEILRDIEYRPAREQSAAKRLDIHRAHGDTEATLLFVHGGGWRGGDKRLDEDHLFAALVEAGVTVVSIDYTLTEEAPYPENLSDVYAALTWLRAHGQEFGIRAERILLGGGSAGGHLTALAVLKGLAEGTEFPSLAGVVQWFPAIDLTGLLLDQRFAAPPRPGSFSARAAEKGWPFPAKLPALLGTSDWTRVPLAAALELDPRFHLDRVDDHRRIPPFLLLAGTADHIEIQHDTRRLYEALESVGARPEYLLVHDADHQDERFARPGAIGAVVGFARAVLARDARHAPGSHGDRDDA